MKKALNYKRKGLKAYRKFEVLGFRGR